MSIQGFFNRNRFAKYANDPDMYAKLYVEALGAALEGSGAKLETIKDAAGVVGISISGGTGLQPPSLAMPAAIVQPFDSTVYNDIPKRGPTDRPGETEASVTDWKMLIGMSSPWPTVAEGERAGKIYRDVKKMTGNISTLGIEDYITDEAKMHSGGFQIELASEMTMQTQAISRTEPVICFDQATAIAPPDVSGVVFTPGGADGTIPVATTGVYKFKFASVSWQGREQVAYGIGAGGIAAGSGSTGMLGESLPSSLSGAVTITSAQHIDIVIPKVLGSWGTTIYMTDEAGSTVHYLGFTERSTFRVLKAATSTNTPNTVDKTANAYGTDGLIVQTIKNQTITTDLGSQTINACYYKNLNGAALTSNGRGGCVQIDDMLMSMWAKPKGQKVIPEKILMGAGVFIDWQTLTVGGVPTNVLATALITAQDGKFVSGLNAGFVRHPATGTLIPVQVHWGFPNHIIWACTWSNPFNDPRFPDAARLRIFKTWERDLFARSKRQTEWGLYARMGPQMVIPFGFGLIVNAPCDASAPASDYQI